MTTLHELCQWLNDLPWSRRLAESDNAFPVLETAHVLAVSLIAGTLVTVDLRVAGMLLRSEPVTRITRALLPWTWFGFGVMVLTGLPLFASEAASLYGNAAFRLKLLFLGLAALNALLFHVTAYRGVSQWDRSASPPWTARCFALISLLLWTGVIVSGRMIAMFHNGQGQ